MQPRLRYDERRKKAVPEKGWYENVFQRTWTQIKSRQSTKSDWERVTRDADLYRYLLAYTDGYLEACAKQRRCPDAAGAVVRMVELLRYDENGEKPAFGAPAAVAREIRRAFRRVGKESYSWTR